MSQIKTKFIADNQVTNAKLAQANTLTLKGNNTGGTANVSDLTVSQVNTMLGDVLANGTVPFTANQSMGSNKLTNVTDPTAAQDAATKNYVDSSVAALNPQESVYAATAGSNISGTYLNGVAGVGATFTTTATGTFTVDGTTPPLNSRILIKDQSSGFQNGIYYISTLGTVGVSTIFTRTLDYDTASDMNSAGLIPVINGTVNALSSWQQVATITTVGTDSLVFTEFTANPSLYLLKANNLSDVASASTSFNNISPLTTNGDLLYYNSGNVRLGIGSTGQVLTVISGEPSWQTPSSSGGTVTSVSVVSTNGFAGTVATATTTPAITISTTINSPVLAGNGTAISAASTTGTGSTAVLSVGPTITGGATINGGLTLGTALSVSNGGTGVTSVTTTPTATAFAGWDANSNLSANSFIDGYATTATAAGTTTLLVGSAQQQYFTGTTTQTVKLPVVSTLVIGQSYTIVNNSTGVVTVQSSGANTLQAMAANTQLVATVISTSGTGTASWSWEYSLQIPGTVTSVSVVSANGFSGTVATSSSTPAITMQTTINSPVLAGNGTAISAATTTGTGSTVVLSNAPTITGNATLNDTVEIINATTATKVLAFSLSGMTAAKTLTLSSSQSTTQTLTIPNITAADTLATLGLAQTFSAATTFSAAGTALSVTNTASIGTLSLSNALTIANGGTGDTSFTAYSVICGGTTSTGALQNVSGVGTANQVLTSNGSGALPTWQTPGASTAPTVTVKTSGSGTYTTPAGVIYLEVIVIGGGGGGGSGNGSASSGGNGGNSTFGTSLLTANGGTGGAGAANAGSSGGTATGGDINITGGTGGSGSEAGGGGVQNVFTGYGGSNPLGMGGPSGFNGGSGGGVAGTGYGAAGGGGGPGGSGAGGAGGGAGGYLEKLISSPSATYSYAVGAAGSASSGGNNGGAGTAGIIYIKEYYSG